MVSTMDFSDKSHVFRLYVTSLSVSQSHTGSNSTRRAVTRATRQDCYPQSLDLLQYCFETACYHWPSSSSSARIHTQTKVGRQFP
jgi:hypothetical protein